MSEITIKLGELAANEAALLKIIDLKFDQAGGAKLRYYAVKLARLVAAETKHYYDERNALVTKYGDGEPKRVEQTGANWAPFLAAAEALNDLDVTIPWGPLTAAMFEPYSDVTGRLIFELGALCDLDAPAPPALVKDAPKSA